MVVKLIGYLTEDSKVREIFPDGEVPLKSPFPNPGRGPGNEKLELYEVDMDKLPPDQLNAILKWFVDQPFTKKLSEQDILANLRREGFRIQKKHFASVPIDMRLFI